MPDTE